MSDRFTEVTTQGWGSRLVGSFVALLFGLVLLPVGIGLLYWNEGRAVDAIRALDRAAAAIVEANAGEADPRTDGKLVHVTGVLEAATPARDPALRVSGEGLLRLARTVEMYQWKEETSSQTHEAVGGTKTTETTYTYRRVWSAEPISSNNFKVQADHRNPPMDLRSQTFDGEAKLGAYRVEPPVLDKLDGFTPVAVTVPPPPGFHAAAGGFYRGQDPDVPAIGDERVSFGGVPAQTVSIAAAQSGGRLTAYRDANGYTIAVAKPGVASAAALFQQEKQAEGQLTWILRGVGFVVQLIGFICLTRPLTMLFAVLPFLESLVGAGAFLVALTLAIPVTLITIAIAWIVHRPLIGGALLAAALVALVLLRLMHRGRAVRA